MNNLKPLIKREVQEHKTLMVYLPLVMIMISVVALVLSLFNLQRWGLDSIWLHNYLVYDVEIGTPSEMVEITGIEELVSLPFETRHGLYTQILTALATPFQAVLLALMTYYFVLSLFQDRKDRSILFWKSMPVSDRDTVLSKLLTGLVLLPVIYLASSMVLQLLVMIIISIYALGFDVSIWNDLWQPSGMLTIWWVNLVSLPLAVIWVMPVYSWILLVSARAKSIPFAWAVGIPFTIVLLEKILFHQELQSDTLTGNFLASHMSAWNMMVPLFHYLPVDALERFASTVLSPGELVVTIATSLLFIWGAVYFRGKAGEL